MEAGFAVSAGRGKPMSRIRFRLRTILILVAVVALMMGVLRFILWVDAFAGIDLLFYVLVNVTIFVFIPILVIVEGLFFAVYLWFRRKRAGQIRRTDGHAAPELRLSGESKSVG
jgi:uncharacterized membrane protein YidH (DUF202 family)